MTGAAGSEAEAVSSVVGADGASAIGAAACAGAGAACAGGGGAALGGETGLRARKEKAVSGQIFMT